MLKKLFLVCSTVAVLSAWMFAVCAQESGSPNRDQTQTRARPNRTRTNSRRSSTLETIADAIISQGDIDEDKKLSKDELSQLVEGWYARIDTSKSGIVNQESFLRGFGRTTSGSRPSSYLGLFVAIDANKDASISRAEFCERFLQWFDAWDAGKRGFVDRENVLAGLRAALPRTNMGSGARATQERPPGLPEPPPSPVLAPAESVKTIELPDGFHIELAATEPMIEDPVALSFDEDGRLYVVEMRSYMLDIDGSDERNPNGRISCLEDTDGDGCFDKSTIFVDHLVLPRSVAAVNGGVLYVSDYKLYFARDTNGDGKSDQNVLVDPDYGDGNVEHAPNGLMTAMDNWIYNAESRYRYRWIGNMLVKQSTENRGQWGITQDNYGRLFYNVNNSQLLGDYTPPNYMSRNQHHRASAGLNLFVATDQRVFPIRMNTAVNRGYLPEVLDEKGRAYVFASSCSPVIYRGDNFPRDFVGNAFVCDSAVNLVKRNLVSDANLTLTSKFAYQDSEFLASTDERFRPVSLSNGPDGTLWLVDMYRGINQYGRFMTDYLRQESLARGLDKGVHFGRIYRIVSDEKDPSAFQRLSKETSSQLVDRLSHPNGWIRDAAQRLLVQRSDQTVVPKLIQLISDESNEHAQIHALWTLEGLCVELPEAALIERNSTASEIGNRSIRLLEVKPDFVFTSPKLTDEVLDVCLEAIGDRRSQVQVAAIRVAESLTRWSPEHQLLLRQELAEVIANASAEVLFQVALTSGNLSKPDSLSLLVEVATRNHDQLLIREAIVSGLERWELPFLKLLLGDSRWADDHPGRPQLLQVLAGAVMRERHPINIEELLKLAASQSSEQAAWRQRSLIEGMSSVSTSRSSGPVRMRSEPSVLKALRASSDKTLNEQIERIRKQLAWPGQQHKVMVQRPKGRPLTADEQRMIAKGKLEFIRVCAGCHGLTGEGIRPLAAPLVDSDWVLGSKDRLIRVLLHGLTGAVDVDGITYQPPIVLPEMPAVGTLKDDEIASVLSYIRREWGHQADPISAAQVARVRRDTDGRRLPWTAEELVAFEDETP